MLSGIFFSKILLLKSVYIDLFSKRPCGLLVREFFVWIKQKRKSIFGLTNGDLCGLINTTCKDSKKSYMKMELKRLIGKEFKKVPRAKTFVSGILLQNVISI